MGGPKGNGRRAGAVLVALEPRVYSHAIGTSIAELRPAVDVWIVEPCEIGGELQRSAPGVVLCSRPRASSAEDGPCWVQFDAYAESPEAEIVVDGTATEIRHATLDDLLSIIDRAIAARAGPHPRMVS